MKIIGFGHRSRSGKDTAADFIVDKMVAKMLEDPDWNVGSPINCFKVSFASVLKEVCQEFYPLLEDEIFYNENPEYRTVLIKDYGMTPVQIWVHVGTALREVNPNIWIELLHRKIEDAGEALIVIPDVRQHNEVEYIQKLGGVCVKINRDIEKQSGASIDDVLEDFDGWDYVINNDDTLDSFLEKIDSLRLKVLYG